MSSYSVLRGNIGPAAPEATSPSLSPLVPLDLDDSLFWYSIISCLQGMCYFLLQYVVFSYYCLLFVFYGTPGANALSKAVVVRIHLASIVFMCLVTVAAYMSLLALLYSLGRLCTTSCSFQPLDPLS